MTPDYVPPPRGLLWVRPVPAWQGGGIELGCDCGTVTQLVIDGLDQLAGPAEMAVTCDGCASVRWFTVTPVEAGS